MTKIFGNAGEVTAESLLRTWINDQEKYALIGLDVEIDKPFSPIIVDNLQALSCPMFNLPQAWHEWLGTIQVQQFSKFNLFLLSKAHSAVPHIFDGESRILIKRVHSFYVALLLARSFWSSGRPALFAGARSNGVVDVRHWKELAPPIEILGSHPQPITSEDLRRAANISSFLDRLYDSAKPHLYRRLQKSVQIYIRARTNSDPLEKIHQYCRCIEGLIIPKDGKTRRNFKNRTELFIGTQNHNLVHELYNIRSAVEHLHENPYLEPYSREVRTELQRKCVIIEHMAGTSLIKAICNISMYKYFETDATLAEFWARPPDEQRAIWGPPIDPYESIRTFDMTHVSDQQLGGI